MTTKQQRKASLLAALVVFHGGTDKPLGSDEMWTSIDISTAVMDTLAATGAGAWRMPSQEEIEAEASTEAMRGAARIIRPNR